MKYSITAPVVVIALVVTPLFVSGTTAAQRQSNSPVRILAQVHSVHGAPIAAKPGPTLPRSANVPGGYLSDRIGTWHAIEGVRHEGPGADEANTLVVDTVDGRKLETPFPISVRNLRLPLKTRCMLEGYESGEMVGVPPAEYKYVETTDQLTQLQQQTRKGHNLWHWIPHFVGLKLVKPDRRDAPQLR